MSLEALCWAASSVVDAKRDFLRLRFAKIPIEQDILACSGLLTGCVSEKRTLTTVASFEETTPVEVNPAVIKAITDPYEILMLTQHQVPHIDPSQVPHVFPLLLRYLKTPEQIAAVPDEKVPMLQESQVAMLPLEKVVFLKGVSQVQAVKREVFDLIQVVPPLRFIQALSIEQVGWITNPDWVPFLRFDMVKHLQEGLRSGYIERVRALPTAQLELLPDSTLEHVTDRWDELSESRLCRFQDAFLLKNPKIVNRLPKTRIGCIRDRELVKYVNGVQFLDPRMAPYILPKEKLGQCTNPNILPFLTMPDYRYVSDSVIGSLTDEDLTKYESYLGWNRRKNDPEILRIKELRRKREANGSSAQDKPPPLSGRVSIQTKTSSRIKKFAVVAVLVVGATATIFALLALFLPGARASKSTLFLAKVRRALGVPGLVVMAVIGGELVLAPAGYFSWRRNRQIVYGRV